jgi:hypothetical protein
VKKYHRANCWTDAELATLRQLYGTMTVSDLSARIGRPKKSIYAKAWELRLKSSIRGVPPLRREVVEQIEEMNRDGMNDVQISAHLRAMGIMVSAVIVGKYRRLAGLPSHQFNPERKAKIAAALALVMQGEDMRRKVAENAITARRAILETRQDFARRSGWPEGLPPRAVAILNFMARVGLPMGRKEIGKAMGVSCLNVVTELHHRGLLAKIGTEYRGRGPRALFTLSATALTILEERARCATETKN